MSAPCEMFADAKCVRICGEPATVGWVSEVNGGLVPICDDCARVFGFKRQYLKPLTLENPSVSAPSGDLNTK